MNSTDIESTVQPTDNIIAPVRQPIPRFSATSEIEYEIKNHPILEELAKIHNTATENPPVTDTKERNLFFPKLNVPERIETDYGTEFTIDVQPDTRFMTHYFMFTAAKEYPDFNVKGYPFTSLVTIVAYTLTLVYCYYLICDLMLKAPRSKSAALFKNDPSLNQFLNLMKGLPVPEDVKTPLQHIAPVLDNQRQNLKFIPTFAGFSFTHNFGYSVPITTFLQIHNIFATCKSSSDPEITMTRIYNCPLINIQNVNYTIGQLFGGPFTEETAKFVHRNWLNLALEAFVNPVVSRSLLQKPTFATTTLEIEVFATPQNVIGYNCLFGFPEINTDILSAFLLDVGRFHSEELKVSPSLGTILKDGTGVTILTHSIETLPIPTWHKLPSCKVPTKEESVEFTILNDSSYAKKVKYLEPAPGFTANLPYTDENIESDLLLVEDIPFDKNLNPLMYQSFDARKHVSPNVLWFQPYDKSSQSIQLSIVLGYKIINEEIDGITIPLPNIELDLTCNNSQYLQGTILISNIAPIHLPTSPLGGLAVYTRERSTMQTQSIGHVYRDMSIMNLPILCNENVNSERDLTLIGTITEQR